jgi:hypothetical protein
MTAVVRQTHEKRASARAAAFQLDIATEELRELSRDGESKSGATRCHVGAACLPE